MIRSSVNYLICGISCLRVDSKDCEKKDQTKRNLTDACEFGKLISVVRILLY